uniref:T9SS type B sorting domain-containing protein n=1 Tax=uncultured Lacinutrix sp. TaxID=574032 RepID=UPI0026129999
GALTGSNVDLTLLTIGSYNFTYSITDANMCSSSSIVTITVDDAPESGTVNGTAEFCEGAAPSVYDLFDLLDNEDQTGTWYIGTDNTGTVTANPIDLSVLIPGTYNYTYDVDAIGTCDDPLVTVQVTINPLPNTGLATPVVLCENDLAANSPLDLFGQLAGNDLGGTWTDDNATGALTGSNVDLTLLTIGTYNFTYSITDANMCSSSSIVTITVDDAPESGTVNGTAEFCEGAAPSVYDLFDLLDNEDQTGTWYIGTDNTGTVTANPIDLSVLIPGTYNYTYDVDAIGTCDDPLVTVQVNINALPNTGVATPVVLCENDLAANSPLDLFGQLAGNGLGGTWTDDNATGALTGSNVDLTLLTIGSYSFTYSITDANVCSNSSTVTITVEDAPNAGTVNDAPEFCVAEITAGQTLNLFDYLDNEDQTGTWNDNTPSSQLVGSIVTIEGLAPGTYTFTYDVDAIGICDDPNMPTVSITISDTMAPTAAATQDFCDTATVADLSATGTVIQWYDEIVGGTPLPGTTVLVDGETYYATQTDATTLCESSTRIEVTVVIIPLPNSGGIATTPISVCNNTTVDLNLGLDGTQDTTGIWYEGTDATGTVVANPLVYDVTGFGIGDYQFTYVVSAAPCADASTTITITVQAPLDAGIDGTLDICNLDDGTTYDLFTQLGGTPDTGGTWVPTLASNTNIFDPNVDTAGTYTYFLTNACGNATSDVVVTVTNTPNAGTDGVFSICAVDVDTTNNMLDLLTVLSGTPDTSGTFTNDDGATGFSGTTLDLSLVMSGTYNFTYFVTAVAPCTINASAIATVTINDTAAAIIVNANPDFCLVDNPTVADLDASVTGTTITWYADMNETIALDPSETLVDGEDYYASQNSANNCESSVRVQVIVSVNDAPTPTLIDINQELCINDAPTINDLTLNITEFNSALNNVVWYDAMANGNVISSTTELITNTTYYAVLIDPISNCESSVRLAVTPDLTGCGLLVIPDGFSPNGDGVNDTFDIDNLGILFPDYDMEIYNRYGNIVYKGNASTPRFDGTSNQSRSLGSGELPVGVYYYIFNYNDGINKPKQGRLYLSR